MSQLEQKPGAATLPEPGRAERDDPTWPLRQMLDGRFTGRGRLKFLAVPSMLDRYMERIDRLFGALGSPFRGEERARFRAVLAVKLADAFRASPHTSVLLDYAPPAPNARGLACEFSELRYPVEEAYQHWIGSRTPPLFGGHPDAMVMEVARGLGDPAAAPVLDLGAGTGRNALPLARLGHPVTAVELTAAFAEQIRADAAREALPVAVVRGDVFDPAFAPGRADYAAVLGVELVTSHCRSVEQLRGFLSAAAGLIRPGGHLLFNLFLADGGYRPEPLVREMSQVMWCYLFTRDELESALAGLPLDVVADEPQPEYERAHLPSLAWPPTGWFEGWATGRDLFPLLPGPPPLRLRWIACRRRPGPEIGPGGDGPAPRPRVQQTF